jgi:hypothetical protein
LTPPLASDSKSNNVRRDAMKYNHAFDIAFSVVSEHPTGEDVTAEQVREALIKRVIQAYDSGELLEAIGAPFDTYEESEE